MATAYAGMIAGRLYLAFPGGDNPFYICDPEEEDQFLALAGLRRGFLPCEADVSQECLWQAQEQRRQAKTAQETPQIIRFPCPGCGRRIRCESEHSGEGGRCPQCKARMCVPYRCGQTAECKTLRHQDCTGIATADDGLCDLCYQSQLEVIHELATDIELRNLGISDSRRMPIPALQLRTQVALGHSGTSDNEILLLRSVMAGFGIEYHDLSDLGEVALKRFSRGS